jgi:glycosyltransferase involved in cell wall biosynthesis
MKTEKNDTPKVSIIVGVTGKRGRGSVFNLLDSFAAREGGVDFEFLVVDKTDPERERVYREQYPWVKLLTTESPMPESRMRNLALEHSRGEIIAFVEDHVLFPPCYLKNLVEAFSKGHRIVGGPIETANPGDFAGWVQYFSEYNKWLPGVPEGAVDDLPGSNFAYRAGLLKVMGPLAEGRHGTETHFHRRAREKGFELYFCHGVKIRHVNEKNLCRFAIMRFNYGRLFAARRGFGVWKRIAYIFLSPLIAVVEYVRILKNARHDRACLLRLVQCTPLLVPCLFIWMAGECTGYLFGPGELEAVNQATGDRLILSGDTGDKGDTGDTNE